MGRKKLVDPKKNAGISLRNSEIERLNRLKSDIGANSLSEVVSTLVDFTVPEPVPSVRFAQRKHLPRVSGIYLLVRDDEVIYVGKSSNLRVRWQNHHKEAQIKDPENVEIFYFFADNQMLDSIESALIGWFNPDLNVSSGSGGRALKSNVPRRVQLRIPERSVELFDSYTPEQLSELMDRALHSMIPGIELGSRMVSVVRPVDPITNTICRLFVTRSQVQLLFPEKRDDFRGVVKALGYEWSAPYWLRGVDSTHRVDRAAEVSHRLLLAGFCVQVESEVIKDKAIAAIYEPEHYRKIDASTAKPWDGWFRITWPRAEDLFDEVKKITAAKWSDGAMYVPPEMFQEVKDFADINDFWLTHEAQVLMQQSEQSWDQSLIVCPAEHRKRQRRAKGKVEPAPAAVPDELRDDD